MAAGLVGGSSITGLSAADSPSPPLPPEPAASAHRGDASPLGNYLVGRYAHARGDYAAAALHLQRVLAEEPDNPSLLRRTVSLLVADGRIEDAAALAQRLLDIGESGRLAQFVLGLRHARDDDYEGALERIDAIAREGVYTLLIPLAEGWLHTGVGSEAAALAALAPLSDRDAYRPFFLLHAALMHDLAGREADAEALLREAIATGGGSHRPVAALGSVLMRAGRVVEARAIYEEYRDQNPDIIWVERVLAAVDAGEAVPPLVTDARRGLAEALLGASAALPQRDGGEASLIYARLALFLRDDLDSAQFLIGEILEDAERLEAAVDAYRSIPAGSDFAWAAQLRAAAGLADLDRQDEAVATLRRMADEQPERTDAISALGDVFRRDEQYAEAAAAYDIAVERIETVEYRHWRLFYVRGIAFERLGEWLKAEADFKRALELEPDQPLVLNYLGYSWVEQGRNLGEARTMIEKAVELRPDDGYIIDSLGWVAYRLGDFEEAVHQLERAVELVAGDPIINDHLGDAYWQVGRLHEARFQWRRVLTLEPEDDLAGQVRRKIADGLSAEAEADGAH
ncbi:MAG: tetratricopeptide repeat protein [Rhodospirillales bacterium]|nr:tetratricopeptide repeat protein [Rhodospirillales bacterium]